MFPLAVYLLCLLTHVIAHSESSPRIVIVGAGASGIAAATKLYEHGFEDIVILEAENRIGGRVNTTQFGEYLVDLGGQWVHGQKGNIAYDLAEPLGLLENTTWHIAMYDNTGTRIPDYIIQEIIQLFEDDSNNPNATTVEGSVGEYYEKRFGEYFKTRPEINATLQKDLLRFLNFADCSLSAADSWYEPSLKAFVEYENCEGNLSISWKTLGYSTILDILMKKIPDASKELPIRNKTHLNSEVTKIDYTGDTVKVQTHDGREFTADHVIVTPSLGVLKADYETLFNPALPESKIAAIKGIGFGTECKIILKFDEPWWESDLKWRTFPLLLNDEYVQEVEKDPQRKWMSSAGSVVCVEHKPHLLMLWVTPIGCRHLETLPDDVVLEQSMEIIHRFLGKDYNVTKASAIIRSHWTQDKHFRGTYSYLSLESDKIEGTWEKISEPVVKNQVPVILFAGEATSKGHYSTVHGAIGSGWREAERLAKHHGKNVLNLWEKY